ncbi:hypothetical protein A2X44_04900 [candidate division CPR3 bacterium GWF2_35_18]|uniref:PKD domain-containing protein n=1 Tax=candidate division CPR3 bacterium GW2011_GWF2_35_18 TaxID=1618350 RepID=A0A0G0BK25_UNCC3|nr:MAG: hypothetical protein UR67_C0003G0061 [candidate division CPR3 bacterium GW2011_GWF2_35_18]OGB63672.1 MAG: hypothetical protein A2X44_04900 [candidate division CPR3 bacterium GWF2_35_18]OGB65007.1 MAG: hypothetical protein A2250_01140 [candidate division CPR3 bacterium RIFOXYA2_FULL_35_13]
METKTSTQSRKGLYNIFASVIVALMLVAVFFGFVGTAAAQESVPDYQPVVDPYPVTVGVTTAISLSPAPTATADIHWTINASDGSLVLDTTEFTVTHVFTNAGDYTVGVTISDTNGVYVNAWLLNVEEPVLTPAAALTNLLTAVMAPASPDKAADVAEAVADVQRALGVVVRGAVQSNEGGSIELRPVQPIAAMSEEARALAMDTAAGTDLHFAWGAGWHNHQADLGAGTQLLSGVFFDSDDPAYFGTTEPISGGLWVSSMYTPNVSLETAEYTTTFTSTQWVDSDGNGMFDLLAVGSPWDGSVVTMSLDYEGVYTETWSVQIGMEPKLISTEGTSPAPATADAFRTSAAADTYPFVPGQGWDVAANTAYTDTVFYGAYFGGADFGGVCNDHCVVSYAGRSYESTDADGNGTYDFFLPGAGSAEIEGPGAWEFTVTDDDGNTETWIFILGATPQIVPAGE